MEILLIMIGLIIAYIIFNFFIPKIISILSMLVKIIRTLFVIGIILLLSIYGIALIKNNINNIFQFIQTHQLVQIALLFLVIFILIKIFDRKLPIKYKPTKSTSVGIGQVGEWTVNHIITTSLEPETYHLLSDVILPTENGTTQIDHIIFSQFGIFAIETKNFKGWIFGSKYHKKWTQKIFKKTYQFQNPLHQNYKHTETISKILNISRKKIFSIVVFTGDCIFKTKLPWNVIYSRNLINHIKSKKFQSITTDNVQFFIKKIHDAKFENNAQNKEIHVNNVDNMISSI